MHSGNFTLEELGQHTGIVIRVSALLLRNCGSSKRFSCTAKLARPDLGPTHLPIELEPGPLALRAK